MTTTVIIEAHCSDDKEVVIQRSGSNQDIEETTVNDGEKFECVVFDSIMCNVFEREKKQD
jgi:hypothetical protein